MTDKYLEGHPLANHAKMTEEWATPIMDVQVNMPDDIRVALLQFIASGGYGTTMGTHDKMMTPKFETNQYNIFNHCDGNELVTEFRNIASEIIRYYCANAWGMRNADQADIQARCFGNMQHEGRRTYPHYHHSFDGVMVHYLTCGGEFDIKNLGEPDQEWIVIPPNSKVERIETGITGSTGNEAMQVGRGKGREYIERQPCEGSGTLLLTDPRPAINYPYNEKVIPFDMRKGRTIIHPAYVWHESNTFNGPGIRCCVVVNFRIGTRNSQGIVSSIPKI